MQTHLEGDKLSAVTDKRDWDYILFCEKKCVHVASMGEGGTDHVQTEPIGHTSHNSPSFTREWYLPKAISRYEFYVEEK